MPAKRSKPKKADGRGRKAARTRPKGKARSRRAGAGVTRVAIVGGGLGGLTAAAFLQGMEAADGRATFACDLFEASGRIGGNMHSAYLASPYGGPFADLAVNDFNATTYAHMIDLIRTLERAGYEVPTVPLIDKDSFFVPPLDGRAPMSYTSDEVADPSLAPDKTYLPVLQRDWAKFRALAAEVMEKPEYAQMSVDAFVAAKGFSDEFRDMMLLPRINAMYFVPGGNPGTMPIRGVMYYYHLQEGLGAGGGPTLRLAFQKGASQWARQLERYVRDRGATIHLNASPTVAVEGGKLRVRWVEEGEAWDALYDHVVCAVPPHRLADVLAEPPAWVAEAARLFGAYPAEAVVHDDARVLPADRSQWMTYNVLIEARGETRPYTMTYVNAMHNGAPLRDPPFVTESPIVDIPDEDVYDMVDLARPAASERVKARATFVHNTVTLDTMAFQDRLWRDLQGIEGVWFTGGWTSGAGLQEQIIVASSNVALRMRGYPSQAFSPAYRRDDPSYVPHYIRRSLGGRKAEAYPAGFWPGGGA